MTDKQDEPMVRFSEVVRVIGNLVIAQCTCHQCLTLRLILDELKPPPEQAASGMGEPVR